jgi:UDP-glucose 4-epimerase
MQSLKGKKILITGGLGFIGSNLAHACVKYGAEVTIFDCLDPHSGGNLYNISGIEDSVKLLHSDVLDFGRITEAVLNKDYIFNCAASTSHSFSMKEPWIDLDINGRAVINILEAIQRYNKKARFIHLGTSTQLGELQYTPADESHPEFPTDIYSANKSVSEKYVLIYSKAFKLAATVARLSNVIGPRASIHSPEFTFNNYFVGLALQNKDITVYGDGKQKRNIIYVDNVINSLLNLALTEKTIGQTYFVVSDDHYPLCDIAELIVKCIGKGRVTYIDWPKAKRSIDFGDAILSNKKIRSVIDLEPQISLIDGLKLTNDYFKTCIKQYLR